MSKNQKKEEIHQYIAANVNTFIQPMVYDILKTRPQDPAGFALKWITKYVAKNQKKVQEKQTVSDSESEEDEAQIAKLTEKIQKKKNQPRKQSRQGISEQVFGSFNSKEKLVLKDVPKSQETKYLILSLIRNSILFQGLDFKDEELVIKAMQVKNANEGQEIIKEGDCGDTLFVVESGQYDCSKIINGQSKYLKTYQHGEAFGELALMYNAPRAATVICKKQGVVYSLDRITFSRIVKAAAMKKRSVYKQVIDKIDIFSDINDFEKQQFYDCLTEEKYEEDQYVIKQGQKGDKFYIVLEGKLVAQKKESLNENPKIVFNYKESDYFGELSLIHDIERQASIKTLTSTRLVCMDRDKFKRILGSIEDILKRNEEKYRLVQEKLICA